MSETDDDRLEEDDVDSDKDGEEDQKDGEDEEEDQEDGDGEEGEKAGGGGSAKKKMRKTTEFVDTFFLHGGIKDESSMDVWRTIIAPAVQDSDSLRCKSGKNGRTLSLGKRYLFNFNLFTSVVFYFLLVYVFIN